jgi:N-acetylglucosamine kinase-like BadF-type ATPase
MNTSCVLSGGGPQVARGRRQRPEIGAAAVFVDAARALSYSEIVARRQCGLYAGLDAGASRTRCVVTDERGALVSVGSGPAGAFHPAHPEASAEAIRQALDEALTPIGASGVLVGLGLGVAGAGRTGRGKLLNLLAATGLAQHVVATHDAEAALWGAFPSGQGIIVIAGTGTVAYGRDGLGGEAQVGGWGREIDDVGGAWWAGGQVLRAVARAHDGRGPATKLTELVLHATACCGPEDLINWAREPTRTPREIAELALLVEEAASQGDAVAFGIIQEAAHALAELAGACDRRLAGTPESWGVALVGGLAAASPILRQTFIEALRCLAPDLQPKPPAMPAVLGAILRLWAEINAPADDDDLRTLISQIAYLPKHWGYCY